MSTLQHVTIAKNENYLAFPDVALAPDGTLVCAYFEGDKHSPTWSNLVIKTSSDFGKTWSQSQSLAQSDMKQDGFCWNCPRISTLPDGRLTARAQPRLSERALRDRKHLQYDAIWRLRET